MKKKEAEVLAPEKIDVIVEYIMQILEDTSKVSGMMNFSSAKIDGQNMCSIFDGVSIVNSIGSEIKVNMYGVDRGISNEYNEKYDEYLNQSMMENSTSRKRV